MKLGQDVSAEFKNLYVVHQNIPGKRTEVKGYDQHILFIPLQGDISVKADEHAHVFGPGQMFYLPPALPHAFSSSSRGGERLIAMYDAKALATQRHGPVKVPLNQLIKEILFYLLLNPKTANASALVDVFRETLGEVLGQTPTLGGVDHQEGRVIDVRVKNALEIMRESIEKRVSLDAIAKRAGLSTRNLNRLIVKETGLQPRAWLINFRIDRARELLKKPGASVTDVALAVGYNSLSQFIAAFRSRTGQLPSDFLKHG